MKPNFSDFNHTASKIIFLIILVLVVIIGRKFIRDYYIVEPGLEDIRNGGDMELIFIGLEEADSTIIYNNGKVLLIDTGEAIHGPLIIKKLQEIGIKKIDYLILTHPDKDHIGGAVDILNAFQVETIIQTSLQEGKALQEALNSTIEAKNIKTIVPEKRYEFTLGNMLITVFPPLESYYKKDNNYSLITLINHKDLSFYFGGDAEKKRLEEALMDELPKVTLYKVPHHGRLNSKSLDMVNKLSPKFAIITSSGADDELINAFKSQATQVFYTGDGDIRFSSNGIDLIKD